MKIFLFAGLALVAVAYFAGRYQGSTLGVATTPTPSVPPASCSPVNAASVQVVGLSITDAGPRPTCQIMRPSQQVIYYNQTSQDTITVTTAGITQTVTKGKGTILGGNGAPTVGKVLKPGANQVSVSNTAKYLNGPNIWVQQP
jgi:hypothetical protein